MKSFTIFTAFVLVFAQSSFAASLPKTAKVILALDQPAVTLQLPTLDLANATIDQGLVKFKQTGAITVGASTYDMDPVAFVNLHEDAKGLTVENLKMLRYRLFSKEINAVVGDVVVDLKTGAVTVNKSAKGVVTEWH